jgi:hypothetical protein
MKKKITKIIEDARALQQAENLKLSQMINPEDID